MTTPQRSTRTPRSERARRPRRCDAVKRAMAVYSAASEAAAAVASCHHEMRLLTAAFANGDDASMSKYRLASARHAVQSACDALDQTMGESAASPWTERIKPADDSLLAAATACVPSWLRERPQSPLTLRNRPCKRANSHRSQATSASSSSIASRACSSVARSSRLSSTSAELAAASASRWAAM